MKTRFPFLLTILLSAIFFASGCAALNGAQSEAAPTSVPTLPPLSEQLQRTIDSAVTDPVSDVVPRVDPDIVRLMEMVSQQQLLAYVQTLESFGTRNSFSAADEEERGIGAARRWIYEEFVRVGNGRLQVAYDNFPLSYLGHSAEQSNIVATLPGIGPVDGVIVVMAHYDNRAPSVTDGESRATGANDNASGVALLLETARVLSTQQWNQTVVFVAMAAEEQGTFGSRHFAERAFANNINVLAALNYDTVGGRSGIPQLVRLYASNLTQSPSGQLGRYYDYIGELYLPTFPVTVYDALDRDGRWGDQREFIKLGMPSIRLIESQEDPSLVNSVRDSWRRIDYAYLQNIVKLNVAVVGNMAGAPPPPLTPLVTALPDSGSFLLEWPTMSGAAGYLIAFRPLESPDYPPFRFTKAREAGTVIFTGLDPGETYAVSVAALDGNGRVSHFSREVIIRSTQRAGLTSN